MDQKKKLWQLFTVWIVFGLLMTALIVILGKFYNHAEFPIDQGAWWYYWRLPNPTLWARITGWTFFILHFAISAVISYKASKEPETGVLTKWNIAMLVTQCFFIVLHLLQTFVWYDSLVHDTPVWLSQVSVIIMLVMMMILLNDKRGLFFGIKVPLPRSAVEFTRNIHGYYILLALTFTFWYHPMEPTVGHLFGFFYMFLLLAQAVFMFTEIHYNRIWVFILEFFVLIHGTAISLTKNDGGWPMFMLGFGFITVVTQIYLLRLKKQFNWLLQGIYLILVIIIYSGIVPSNRTFARLYELTFIPGTEYVLVFIMCWIFAIVLYVFSLFRSVSTTSVRA